MNDAPKVSVVIAAYRAERFIAHAVRSAQAQSLNNIEVIVVDDQSGDGTLAAAQAAAAGDARVRTLQLERNGGPSAARNAGFEAAKGEWIAVLDADDAMAPDRLEKLVAFAEDGGVDIAADALVLVESNQPDAEVRGAKHAALTSPLALADFALDNCMYRRTGGSGYLKPLFRRAFLERHQLNYDESLRIAEDWALAAEALACGARYGLLQEPLYRYSVHADSISHRISSDALERIIASSDAFLERRAPWLSRDEIRALGERRASLVDALAFQRFVDGMKARKPLTAIAGIAGRPSAWPLLRLPIGARLSGARGGRRLAD
jgi:succinoglycan biosynthesis protein ExoO